MNLTQAYNGWQQMSENRELYVKTREAFRKAWFMLPMNKPCSYYTKEVLGMALAETRVIQSFKAKAASVMCHVLAFAHWAEPKFNPEPDFTFDDLMEYTKGPLADPEKIAGKQEQDDEEPEQESGAINLREAMTVPEIDIERVKTKAEPVPCDEHGNALPDEEPLVKVKPEALARRKAELEARKETKTGEDMKEKKRSTRPRRICQIDPETLQVVKTYDSCSEGCRAAGVKNLDRAIKKLQKAGGYYWQYPEDVATFAERLRKNPQEEQSAKKKSVGKKPKPDEVPVSVVVTEQATKPKFKAGDHVWAKTPVDLYGRTGYVKAFDARSMTYDVLYGTDEMWMVREADLELVNEDAQKVVDKPIRNVAHEVLEAFTDDELLEELDRRGWQGEIRKVLVVTIGEK